eukprot:1160774-Pelagomonas_calceolata.AAC.6
MDNRKTVPVTKPVQDSFKTLSGRLAALRRKRCWVYVGLGATIADANSSSLQGIKLMHTAVDGICSSSHEVTRATSVGLQPETLADRLLAEQHVEAPDGFKVNVANSLC